MIGKCLNLCGELLINRELAYWVWRLKHSHSLKKYRDIHRGEDCFIVGNGPSLNKIDLNSLNDYYSFGLNKIYLIFCRTDFRPTYHVAVNPLVIEQSVREIESFSFPTFLSYSATGNLNKNIKHANFIMTGGPLRFCKDLIQPIHEGWTVTYVAMQIAYYMGFKNIFLVGVDHNFNVNGNPNEKQFLEGSDQNHFDENYFCHKEWHLPDLEGSEASYKLAKFFYERDGRQIYDATVGGKLKIYKKLSFNEALSLCKKRSNK